MQYLVSEMKSLKTGVENNAAKWTNMPVTAAQLQTSTEALIAKDKQLAEAENAVEVLRGESRDLVAHERLLAKQVENLAWGLHQHEPKLLGSYGIAVQRPGTSIPAPGKAMIAGITDDPSGEGFVISILGLANAESFEVEKGNCAQADTMVLAPPYPHFQTTRKLNFSDDEVKRGTRYFYRVRGFNRNGSGEWSEPVSRVQ
ncbi:MAG: fibronectin type III domain-containing protein [Ferruginibacter sp.]